jgi:hypothetical protein
MYAFKSFKMSTDIAFEHTFYIKHAPTQYVAKDGNNVCVTSGIEIAMSDSPGHQNETVYVLLAKRGKMMPKHSSLLL